jgi:superfamily II DNA or RNA helicase
VATDTQADITVSLMNHSFLRIHAEAGIKRELRDYFSFYVPNYKFMPEYKNGFFDGKIRLYNAATSSLPAGLLFRLRNYAQSRKYSLELVESSYGIPDQIEQYNPDILAKISTPWIPHDYQQRAVELAVKNKRRVIVSPTGSGKSLIIYLIVRYYLNLKKQRVLIIVPTTSLVEQMTMDFIHYAEPDNMDMGPFLHKVYCGASKHTDKPIVISTWQSLQRLPREYFTSFGCVIGDECHLFKAKCLTNIMNKCENADYRFGLTGTLDGKFINRIQLEGLFGPVHKTTTTKKLQEEGTLAPLEIVGLFLQYTQEEREYVKGFKYQDEIDFIVRHEKRNRFIRDLSLGMKGNTLLLYTFVEKHGEELKNLIREKRKDSVYYIHGGTDVEDRERVRAIIESEKNAIIVASVGVFSTGINIRNIHNIIFASPTKSQIRVLQSIGRGLRLSDDGRTTHLYDIVDDLTKGSKKNYAIKHANERFKIYKNEEFNVSIYDIPLTGAAHE